MLPELSVVVAVVVPSVGLTTVVETRVPVAASLTSVIVLPELSVVIVVIVVTESESCGGAS